MKKKIQYALLIILFFIAITFLSIVYSDLIGRNLVLASIIAFIYVTLYLFFFDGVVPVLYGKSKLVGLNDFKNIGRRIIHNKKRLAHVYILGTLIHWFTIGIRYDLPYRWGIFALIVLYLFIVKIWKKNNSVKP